MKRILLVRSNIKAARESCHPINIRPPYTLKYIQALLKTDNQSSVKFIDAFMQRLTLNQLLNLTFEFSSDIIVIFTTFLDSVIALEYIKMVKQRKPEIIIFVIGPGPSSLPEIYRNNNIDFMVKGEAELKVCSIIKKINKGANIRNLQMEYRDCCQKNIIIENLDSLPFLEYSKQELVGYSYLYPLKIKAHLRWGHLLTSRGCPHRCIFCSQIMRESYGRRFRTRSAANVVMEMQNLKKKGVNVIAFDDDNFTTSSFHVRAICNRIISEKVDVKWIVHGRVDELTPSLLQLMKKAGCILLRYGIETGSKRILEILDKTDSNNTWFDHSKKIIQETKSLGISTACLFIIGNPTETQKDLQQSIEFAKVLDPDIIQAHYFAPYPGSTAYRLYNNKLNTASISKMYHYQKPPVNLSRMTNKELEKVQSLFYKKVVIHFGFAIKHFFKYFQFYLYNPNVLLRLSAILKKCWLRT